uniref:EGF-like domain-containing protein n=1 Tax=Panagrolaimus superbus TaxID=310955 RepID=A0A914YHW7_9BILA
MRLLVAQILWALIAFDSVKGLIVQQNQPCNKDRDILLAEDPTGDKQAFLRCVGVGVGTIGFWERRFCPNDMTFDFVNQQCKTPIANQIVNIFSGQSNSLIPDHTDQHNNIPAFAILNGTCAKGEQCIGGTVCDLELYRCLCPIGTITNLETLSCVETNTYGIPTPNHDGGFPQAKIYPAPPQIGGITPAYFRGNNENQQFGGNQQQNGGGQHTFNSYNSGNGYGSSNNNNNNNNNNYQNTFGNQPRNGFGNNGYNSNTNNNNNNNFANSNNQQQNNNGGGFSNFVPKSIIDTFLPPKNNNNNNQQQNSGVFLPEPSPIEPVSALVKPGGSCSNGEQCGGGSLCTNPMKLCLCPGELEDHGGQCILPLSQNGGRNNFNNYPTTTPLPTLLPSNLQMQTLPPVIITQPPHPSPSTLPSTTPSTPQIIRVGIGAYCNQYAECDYDSTCILSRCRCVEPLIDHYGKCVLKLAPIEVGPGELCDNGEICGKGSICDSVIPVCVCPAGTDLNDGVCVRIQQTYPPSPQTLPPTNYPQPTAYQTYQTIPPTMTYPSSARPSSPHQQVVSQVVPQVYNNLGTAPPAAPPSYPTRPPTMPPTYPPTTSKSNYMKIQLGGSKQAGVGVRCSLNTDCMIGAYCNGNTHPPTCQCLSTHVNVNGRCEKEFSSPGGSCNREKISNTTVWVPVCLGGAICRSNKRCECPEPLILVGKQCVNGTKYLLEKQALLNIKTSKKKIKTTDKMITRSRRDTVAQKKRSLECYPDQKICADGKGVCIQQLCQCLHNYVYSNGKCISEVLPLGAFCDPDVESPICIANSTCLNGACICMPEKECHAKEIKRSPVNVKSYSESCNSGDICLNGTICVEGHCGCPNGYIFEDDSCTRSTGTFRSINSQCLGNDRCSGGSLCTNSICSCVDGSVEAQGRCRQRPGGRCSYGQSCAGGSVCQLGLCQCPPGKRLLNHHCTVSVAKPGESCQSGQKCINGGVCRFGICMCLADHHINDGKCEKQGSKYIKQIDSKALGTVKQPPSVTASATASAHQPPKIRNGIEATTSSAKVFISTGKLIHAKPGQLCLDGEICTGKSQCQDGYCICREEEIIIDDKCVGNDKDALKVISEIKKSAPGQYCADETACTGNSVCMGNVCVCPAGTELLQNECQESEHAVAIAASQTPPSARSPGFPGQDIETRQPGSRCQLTLHCPYRTECLRGVCRCKKGETIVSGTCRKANHESLPGGNCDPKKGLDCIGESQCYYGICVCLYGLVNNGKECESPEAHMYNIQPGGECSAEALCSENSYCSGGICRCNDNFVVDVNRKCVPKSSTVPFYAYPIGKPPQIKGTKLVYGPGTPSILPHSVDGKFHQILTANQMSINVVDQETLKALLLRELGRAPILNEPCEEVCGGGAKCINSRCQCEQGYQAYDEKCYHLNTNPILNSRQPVSQQTQTFSSLPSTPSALLTPSLPSTPISMTSEPEWKTQGQPGRVCAPAGICFNSAVCIQNQCVCRPGYRAANGYCEIAKVSLGQSCYMNEQCNEGLCEHGKCNCAAGVDAHGRSRCPQRGAARPGEDCTNNQMCSYNSVCGSFSGVCECPVGMETFFQAGECRAATRSKGPACFSSATCHKFSYCDNGYCLCKSGYTATNGYCLPPATPVTPRNSRLDLSEARIYEKEISSNNVGGGNPGAAIGEIVGRGSGYGVNLGTLIGKGMLSAEESARLKTKLMLVDEQTKSQNFNSIATAAVAAASGVPNSQLIPPQNRELNPQRGGYGSLPNNFTPSSRPSLNMENYQRIINGINSNNNPRISSSNNIQAFHKLHGGYGSNVRPQMPTPQSQTWQELTPSPPPPPPPPLRQPFGQTFGSSYSNNNNLPDSMTAYGPDWQKYDNQGYFNQANNSTSMAFENTASINPWQNRINQPDFYGNQQSTPQFPRVEEPEYPDMPATQSAYFTTTTLPQIFTNNNNYNNQQQQNFNGYGPLPLSIINSKLPSEGGSTTSEKPFYIVNPDSNAPAPSSGQLYQMNQFGQYSPYNNQMPMTNPFYPSALPSYLNQMPMSFSGYNGYPQFSAHGSKTMDLSNSNPNYYAKMQHPPSKMLKKEMEFSMPGEFCGNGAAKCLGNSICAKGWCRCPDGVAVENGICAYPSPTEFQRTMPKIRRSQHSPTDNENAAKPLQSCANAEICGNDSICKELKTLGKVCLCQQGMVYLDGGCVPKGTWKTTKLGGNCSGTDVCENGGYCFNEICKCHGKMRSIDEICVKISKPGESCSAGEYCINNSLCSKETKSCICALKMTLRQGHCINKHANAKMEKVKSLPGQYCDIHTECTKDSYCSTMGICECPTGQEIINEQCINADLIKLPGDSCNVYSDFCSKDSECSEDGICVCLNGAEPKENECPQNSHLKIQKLGEACTINDECPKGTYCQSGECYCNLHMVKATKDRKSCDQDNDCEVGLTCGEEKFCECKLADASGEFILPMPKKMRKVKRSSDENQDDEIEKEEEQQRESFPITQDKDYSRQAAIHLPLKARKSKDNNKINSETTTTMLLHDGLDETDEKIRSPPGGSCSEEEECSGGSVCREGWCVCPDPSMIVTRGLCVQTQPRPTVPPPQITNGQTGTNRPIQQSSLLPSARKAAPGTSCGPLDICVGGSTCIDSICLCPAGMQPNQQTARCEKPEASKTSTTKTVPASSSSGSDYLTHYSTRQPLRPRPRPVTVISEPYYPNERFENRQTPSQPSSPPPPPTRRPTVINNNNNNFIITEELENIENGSDLTPVIGIESGGGNGEELDECEKAGLYCRGGTICIDLTCQCPPSYILHNDQCIPPITPRKIINKRKGKPSYRGTNIYIYLFI